MKRLGYQPALDGIRGVAPGVLAAGGFPREVGGVALSIVAAALSYRFVEQPFLRRKRRFVRVGPGYPKERPATLPAFT